MTEDIEFKVFWSDEDHEFVATCPLYPSLSWLDEDREEALVGIKTLVADIQKDMNNG